MSNARSRDDFKRDAVLKITLRIRKENKDQQMGCIKPSIYPKDSPSTEGSLALRSVGTHLNGLSDFARPLQ